MTTIHVAPRGARQPSDRYLELTLQNGGQEPVALIAPRDEIRKALVETGGVGRFDLQIGKDPKIHHAIAIKVETADKGSVPSHVVVREVDDDAVVRMQVLLRVRNLPEVVRERKAQVLQHKRHITLRGKLSQIPEYVTVDLGSLGIDGSLRASELALPEGVELVNAPEEEIFLVRELIKPS